MPDPSHQAKRLVDAAVVNGPFTYAGWSRYLNWVLPDMETSVNYCLMMKERAHPGNGGSPPSTAHDTWREAAEDANRPTDTQTVDEWIRQHDRYE